MPLRAEWKGENVCAFDFTPREFEEFREKVKEADATLEMPCCGTRACLRVSPRSLPHFYHYRRGDCERGVGESAEHLVLKQKIAEACRDAGYEVATEVGGDGFVADVMVELPGETEWRVAFEVQLSWQSSAETLGRQKRRREAKVRTCWLSSQSLVVPSNGGRVPGFELAFEEDDDEIVEDVKVGLGLQGRVDWGEVPLRQFVADVLEGQLTWKTQCNSVPMREIVYFRYGCRECKATTYVYYYLKMARRWCECGELKPRSFQPLFPWNSNFEKEIIYWVEDWAERLGLPVANVKASKKGREFRCPKCGNYYDQRKVWKSSVSVSYAVGDGRGSYPVVKWSGWPGKSEYQHWCYTADHAEPEVR
jgi:hypothetical protein